MVTWEDPSYSGKKSIHRGALIIGNIYALNIGALKYKKKILTE